LEGAEFYLGVGCGHERRRSFLFGGKSRKRPVYILFPVPPSKHACGCSVQEVMLPAQFWGYGFGDGFVRRLYM